MNFILSYFWGICIIVAALHTAMLKKRMPKTESEEEIRMQKKVLLAFFLVLAIPCLLLQIFQLLGNYHSPLYLFYRDFSNPFYWLGIASLFLAYFAILIITVSSKNIEKYSRLIFGTEIKKGQFVLLMIGIIVFALVVVFGFSSMMGIKESLEKLK